ncbi:MAG: hypothetical protein DCF27_10030 [Lysobacteraceae bacterium]|nr:MAG: hypothetical protein DCF27_10030 [Xanthomonadaceae bacterium]
MAGLLLASGAVMAGSAWAQDPPASETADAAPAVTDAVSTAAEMTDVATAEADTVSPEPQAVAEVAPAEPVFTSGNQIESSLRQVKGKDEPIAILSAMQLYWGVRSQATSKGGIWNKHQSKKQIYAPVDKAVLERVLLALESDLEARFEAAGWQARTRAELGTDVPDVKTLRDDKELGVPLVKFKGGENELDSAVIALPGAGTPDPKSIGNGMAYMRYFKGKSGINFNVTYTFAPGTAGETQSRMVGTEVGTGLWFTARADLVGAKGGWGSVNVQPEGLVVDNDVGTLSEIAGSKAGLTENAIRYVGGLGTRDRTGYTMTPDWDKAEAAMLRAGRAFNAELVSALAK